LEGTARTGFLCSSCGADYPAYSTLVPVLIKPEDRQAVHSWLGSAPGQQEAFDRYVEARRDSLLMVKYYDWWLDRLMQMIPNDNLGPVAELMCGRAELARRLPSRFSVAAASDINVKVCEAARRDLDAMGKTAVQVFCSSAGCLPMEDQSVGAVVIQGALHHARPILTKIFAEIHRVLKPGGVFVGSEPANDALLIRLLRKVQYRFSSQQGNDPEEDGFTREELSLGLAAAGLQLDSYVQFGTVAYVLMGNTDLVPLLARSRNTALGQFLLRFDACLERLPLLRGLGMASLFSASKAN
jgi:SAM-dependent methyltransferase